MLTPQVAKNLASTTKQNSGGCRASFLACNDYGTWSARAVWRRRQRFPLRHRNEDRFTLTELLVVIAIFAILVSMLRPALSSALALAQQVSCAANQRQIGASLLIYVEDYDGSLPAPFGRNGAMFGAWAIPIIPGKEQWTGNAGATTAWIRDYMGGPVTSEKNTNHVLRCPANGDWQRITGDFYDYQSTYFYTAPTGFSVSDTGAGMHQFRIPFTIQNIARIADKYGFPYLLLLDRVDYRYRWENIDSYPINDSNHGRRAGLRGGNALYHDGHVSWHSAYYQFTGTMAAPEGWQVSHNDAWSAFLIPNDSTANIKNGNRTRFFKGPAQSSGYQWYNPLTEQVVNP